MVGPVSTTSPERITATLFATHHRKVVGDEEHSQTTIALQLCQQSENLRLHGDVERGGRFVGDEQAWAIDGRHGDENALPLAAGKLVRVIAIAARSFGDRDFFKRFDARRFDSLPVPDSACASKHSAT
jgi:hypothetical protein